MTCSWTAVHEARPLLAVLLGLVPAHPLLQPAGGVTLGPGGPGGGGALTAPLLLVLLAAGVAGAALGRADARVEQTAVRHLAPARLTWFCVLTGLVFLGMLGAASAGAPDDAVLSVGRNALGLLGLAAAAAVLLTAELAWFVPAAYTAACVVAGTHQSGELSGTTRTWAWVVDSDPRAGILAAAACWAAGAVVYALRGAR